jgi:hypothetical protein
MHKQNRPGIKLDAAGLFLAGLNNTFFALLVALFIHGPGTTNSQTELMLRAAWITENTKLWQAGWLFWFAPTLTFSWSYYALGRHLDTKKNWRNLAIGVAIIAAAVDVIGILINLTMLPELASALTREVTYGDPVLAIIFRSMEKLANNLTNVGGYGLYTLAGLLILPSAFATQGFPRWLKILGVIEWGISSAAVLLLIFAPALSAVPLVISFLFYAPWVWGSMWWILKGNHGSVRK